MNAEDRSLKAYAEASETTDRRQLIVDNLPVVKYVLGRLAIHLPPHVDRDDLMEAGVLGLIDAAHKFDASRNVLFRTYAVSRIRGSIIDEMRRQDWLPRSMRDEVSRLGATREQLRQCLGRPPTLAEIAKELDVTVARLDHIITGSMIENIYSLEETPRGSDSRTELGHTIPAREDRDAQPFDRVAFEEKKGILADAVGRLSESERVVITLYYYEDMLLREIGEIMGLSDSRVCQVHRAALKRLQRALRSRLDEVIPEVLASELRRADDETSAAASSARRSA